MRDYKYTGNTKQHSVLLPAAEGVWIRNAICIFEALKSKLLDLNSVSLFTPRSKYSNFS